MLGGRVVKAPQCSGYFQQTDREQLVRVQQRLRAPEPTATR
jgi:hypothetical protein